MQLELTSQTSTQHSADSPLETAVLTPRLLLIGNPNVGKSVIFSYLTGKYVAVSNYPGTTVEVSRGKMRYGGRDWEVIDTPGVNSLVPQSEDERVTRDMLLTTKPDVIVQVADAKNLRRTLLVTSQLAALRLPMVLVLNMMDEARSRGIEIDCAGISQLFGIPVVPAVAIDGEGLRTLFKTICHAQVPRDPLAEPAQAWLSQATQTLGLAPETNLPVPLVVEWLHTNDAALRGGVENWLGESGNSVALVSRPSLRKLANSWEERRNAFLDQIVAQFKRVSPSFSAVTEADRSVKLAALALAFGCALFLYSEVGRMFGWVTPYDMANAWLAEKVIPAVFASLQKWRMGWLGTLLFGQLAVGGGYENGLLFPAITQLLLLLAPVLVPLAVILRRSRRLSEQLGHWTRTWHTGSAILVLVLLLMYEFVGVLGAATLVDALENNIFNTWVTPFLRTITPAGFFYDLLIGPYGLVSVGLTYALAIVLPIVTTFFLAFGLLEDSGYLPRLAILADRLFRLMGLNGKAVLPMVLGLGCDTMATMTTRILATKKERLIATLLLALGVPCSAQLGVILAISGSLGVGAVLTVFGVVASQMLLVGYLSAQLIRGERSEFIFEIPPIRNPVFKNVWFKTRTRLKWYLREALPLFLIGTLILFVLDRVPIPTPWGRMNGLGLIESALSPLVTGWLHLPEATARVLLLGFLRRDYGAAGLLDMVRNGTMNPVQIVVSLIVLTLFIPCIANFFMMIREHGVRIALYMLLFITPYALLVGGLVSVILRVFQIQF